MPTDYTYTRVGSDDTRHITKKKYYGWKRRIDKKYRQRYLIYTLPIFVLSFLFLTIYFKNETTGLEGRFLSESGCGVDNTQDTEDSVFPKDLFSKDQLQSGAIGFHILCMCYMFMGLAIICDDYFEPSLEACCESLQLTEDVAGATFMAAGGSAPELATSIVGVFFAQNDIGFGTIVGSAVFNVLFVIAICAWVAPGLELSWWPLVRDCSFYCTSILILVVCVMSQDINLQEAILLFCCYLLYVLIMKFNENIYLFVSGSLEQSAPTGTLRVFVKNVCTSVVFKVVIFGTIVLNLYAIIMEMRLEDQDDPNIEFWTNINFNCSMIFLAEFVVKSIGYGVFTYWTDSWNAIDGGLVFFILAEFLIGSTSTSSAFAAVRLVRFVRFSRAIRIVRVLEAFNIPKQDKHTQTREKDFPEPWVGLDNEKESLFHSDRFSRKKSITIVRLFENNKTSIGKDIASVVPYNENRCAEESEDVVPQPFHGKAGPRSGGDSKRIMRRSKDAPEPEEESEDDGPDDLFDIPEHISGKFFWGITFLLRFLFSLTIYDTTKEGYKKYWSLSFAGCVTWIAILSYIMVWMATVLGDTFNIPDPVMGLTLLAGGTSIPDLLSSAAVARRGLGDMAVSSSIGSNIFDILIGLPVPWMIFCSMNYPGTVPIKSDGLTIMVLSLFLMVAFVCLLIHYHGWVLSKRLAYSFVALYFGFVVESLLLEYGIIFKTC